MRIEEKSKLVERYNRLSQAYLKIFDPKAPYTNVILDDLAEFCRANESTFHLDARAHALLEGRREVWLHIREYLTMNADELIAKKTKPINP